MGELNVSEILGRARGSTPSKPGRATRWIAGLVGAGAVGGALLLAARAGLGGGTLALLGVAEALSLFCLVNLWGKADHPAKKVLWSVAVMVPVVGPIFYGGMYELPEPKLTGSRGRNI